jgi:hypothetical protein
MESRDEVRRRLGRTDAVIDGVVALAPIGAPDEVGWRSRFRGDRPDGLWVPTAIDCHAGQPGRKTNERAENRRNEVGDPGA